MKAILQSIKDSYCISDKSLKKLSDRLLPIEIRKKTILVSPEKINNNLYFIERGVARSFTIMDGKEITSWFSKEGDLIYSTNSFYGKRKGYESERVQVLENSLFYYISIPEIHDLCLYDNDIANWLRVLHQNAFVDLERRLISRLYLSAEERYHDFFLNNKDLFNRVNLGHIASYLGMSHVTLCALRK
ncbi:Crp/Fnr family transcriptional regulator [Chryseobacterium culicis]|jgi:hypothetical protein|uniref:cAMP-binding domain of CRP or a regulatory subunit of cAMP-dependent protein kinases n=1 Tax=Chryseobacterium culicis TaxID=680127 RepID=A0A1H6H5F7_CHRCI|nr:Crp/Fnr family transcriptional regulator [Chryseobacterium culicis]MBE4948184.1 Crp/Fnr family transcriptional regulator [Chryseobacterium culicis]SEH30522.1 cAMP-binding domain of CRP or a regulatory subunit of cAMP-dependent protein kinases [Chryseobacterium culicis]